MKLIKDEDIALAIQPGWLVKYEIVVAGGVTEYRFSEVHKYTIDKFTYELYFNFGDYDMNVIDIWVKDTTPLDDAIVAVYKLSKRGNYIKVWERD